MPSILAAVLAVVPGFRSWDVMTPAMTQMFSIGWRRCCANLLPTAFIVMPGLSEIRGFSGVGGFGGGAIDWRL
jgi:hypothetical protein